MLGDHLGLGSAWWFTGAAALAIGSLLVSSRAWGPVLLVGVALSGAGWAQWRFDEPPVHRLDALVPDGGIVVVRARVASTPALIDRSRTDAESPGAWRDDETWFDVSVTGAQTADGRWVTASGVVRVRGPSRPGYDLRIGQVLTLTGRFNPGSGPRNPGEPDWSRWENERGRAGWITVSGPSLVQTEQSAGLAEAVGWVSELRSTARARALRALGADEAPGVVPALVLGERDPSFDRSYRVFQRAGVAHVLAVSGFHVALLVGASVLLVRTLGDSGRAELFVVLLVIGAMLVLIPARAPVIRACVIVLAMVAAGSLGRRHDRLAVLGWTAVGVLIWRPGEAFSLGFQLSFGVTALLLLLADRARPALMVRTGSIGTPRTWLWTAFKRNTACWAVATPTIAATTGVVSVLAPVATLAVVPFAGVLLVLGWIQALLGTFLPGAATTTTPWITGFGEVVETMVRWIDALPGSAITVSGLGPSWAIVTTGAVLGVVFSARRRVWLVVVSLCVVWAAISSARSGRVDGLRIDMFDVGNGTSMLIRSGNESLLWDCGSLDREVGATVADACRSLGVRRVDTAIITHNNLDHFNGLPEAAELLGIRVVRATRSVLDSREPAWLSVRDKLERAGVRFQPITLDDEFSIGTASGRVLWPPPDGPNRWIGNDASVALRIRIEQRTVLMTGDLQRAGIAGLIASGADLRADIVEAPHHGSATPTGIELVERTAAGFVLQSTGRGRVSDERWSDIRRATRWWSTAEHGAAWIEIDSEGVIRSGSVRGSGSGSP